jgi:hypothetical protein
MDTNKSTSSNDKTFTLEFGKRVKGDEREGALVNSPVGFPITCHIAPGATVSGLKLDLNKNATAPQLKFPVKYTELTRVSNPNPDHVRLMQYNYNSYNYYKCILIRETEKIAKDKKECKMWMKQIKQMKQKIQKTNLLIEMTNLLIKQKILHHQLHHQLDFTITYHKLQGATVSRLNETSPHLKFPDIYVGVTRVRLGDHVRIMQYNYKCIVIQDEDESICITCN